MEHGFFIQILLMLVIAIVAIALLRRIGLPAILAYLLTGVISGPSGFNWFSQHQMQSVAELGVVLLMFTLGLEFSVPRLWAMRRTVFGLGSAQVVLTTLLAMGAGLLFISDVTQALVIGSVTALSSTAIVLKLLNDKAGSSAAMANYRSVCCCSRTWPWCPCLFCCLCLPMAASL